MARATAQRLRDIGARPPERLRLITPGLDITLGDQAVPNIEPRGPLVSPVNGKMAGLPSTSVFIGTRDILSAETHRFRDLATAAGVEVEFHEAAGDVHAYPLSPTAEAKRARQQIVQALVSTRAT
ncbi:alpha/beta hydrolase [Streptomyces sp. NPDC048248]|uniref:alpha/beta hydrolase n=1 Tax=Streptomyces sp. NPDC048248 TaxID=3365523 RepID=UPI00371C223F